MSGKNCDTCGNRATVNAGTTGHCTKFPIEPPADFCGMHTEVLALGCRPATIGGVEVTAAAFYRDSDQKPEATSLE